jgi:hypothetical protein
MRAGQAFKTEVEGVHVGVIYTSHFVQRYHADIPNRPAAARLVSEEFVRSAIEQAIPEIIEYQEGDPELSGVIVSKSLKLNMSFEVKPKATGFTIIMKNMMVKGGYERSSLKDYTIEINPKYRVDFPRSIDPDLKVAVLDDLPTQVPSLEDDEVYDILTPEASYTVERAGDRIHIHDADWLEDMLIIDVP